MIEQLTNQFGLDKSDIINLLPFVLLEIRNYTRQYFITKTNADIIKIEENKCYFSGETKLVEGDVVELLNSENNSLIYTIKEVKNNYIELDQFIVNETASKMKMIKLAFKGVSLKTVFDMIEYSTNFKESSGIKSQTLGGYNVTFAQPEGGETLFPIELYGGLNSLKKLDDDYAEYGRKGYVRI